MNAGEYGIIFYFDVDYDLSAATSISLVFTRPDGTTLTVATPSVILGITPTTAPNGQVYAANQYVTYTFKVGDAPIGGNYTIRLTAVFSPTLYLTSTSTNFFVGS